MPSEWWNGAECDAHKAKCTLACMLDFFDVGLCADSMKPSASVECIDEITDSVPSCQETDKWTGLLK